MGMHLTEAEVQNMMDQADINHSGTIDFEEFLEIFKKQKAIAQANDEKLETSK